MRLDSWGDISVSYSHDGPIDSPEDDVLGRVGFANRIADALESVSKGEPSIALGLYGPWGSGKTSVINLVATNLKECNGSIEVIRFDPWNCISGIQLIEQYYQALEKALRSGRAVKAADVTAQAISDYWSALLSSGTLATALSNMGVLAGLETAIPAIAGIAVHRTSKRIRDKRIDVFGRKANLEKELLKLQGKIVVIIDDIDRLPNDQIRMIFQLIASLAKLPNIHYLLAFDDAVVIRALEKVQEGDGRGYLDKIVQIPVKMPKASAVDIRKAITDGLKTLIQRFGYRDYDIDSSRFALVQSVFLSRKVETMRDVKRYLNALQMKIIACSPNASFLDMIAIVYMEIYEPQLIDWILANRGSLCGGYYPSLRAGGSSQIENKELLKKNLGLIGPSIDVEWAYKALCVLFPGVAGRTGSSVTRYSDAADLNGVWRQDCFDMYFASNVDSGVDVHEIEDVCTELDGSGIKQVFANHVDANDSIRFVSGVHARGGSIPDSRVELVCKSFISCFGLGKESDERLFQSTTVDKEIVRLCESCFERLGSEKTMMLLKPELENHNFKTAVALSEFLLQQRNALKSEGYTGVTVVLSKEDVEALCLLALETITRVAEGENLFERSDADEALYLFKEFDGRAYSSYVKKLVEEDDLACIYFIRHTAGIGRVVCADGHLGRISSVVFSKESFGEGVPIGQLQESVDRIRRKSCFWDLPEDLVLIVAAFALLSEDQKELAVEVEDAEAIVAGWRGELDK